MSCSHLFQTYSIPLVILIMQLWKSTTLVASNEPQRVAQLCPTLCNPMDCPWNSLAQNIGVGSLSLPFPTQGLNPGHPHCRQILYQLSHKRSPGKSGEGWIRGLGLTDIHYYVTDTHYCTVSNDLLYSTRNYIQYCIITYNGKESEK